MEVKFIETKELPKQSITDTLNTNKKEALGFGGSKRKEEFIDKLFSKTFIKKYFSNV